VPRVHHNPGGCDLEIAPSVKSPAPLIRHHGGASGVTGSCHRLEVINPQSLAEHHVLVDCGIFQGQDADRDKNAQHEIDFDLSQVRALIVTHVHIDHIGRLPYLIAAGFAGPIICSVPTARLLPLVIEDALKVGFTRDPELIEQFVERVQAQLQPVDYRHWVELVNEPGLKLSVRLQRAGHILGSAYVEVATAVRPTPRGRLTRHRTVFSGDLGAPHSPLLPSPKSPYRADTLVIESTYGNRTHENRKQRKQRLKQAIDQALRNGGTVLVPAFSIGRTQELLYELEGLLHQQALADLDIIVDSPLAAAFTEVYRELKPYWDEEATARVRAGRHPLSFDKLITVDSHELHLKMVEHLAHSKRPALVIAASGMVAGGRIVQYMKAMISDPTHAVLFLGYQAPGTPGHQIQKHGRALGEHLTPLPAGQPEPWVELDGTRYPIRAGITSIGGYSAHAGQDDLVNFVKRMRHRPREIRIVHGNPSARQGLAQQLQALVPEAHIVLPENE